MSDSYLGIYKGIVTDNDDPERSYRVVCQVPQVLGDAQSAWAEPLQPTLYTPRIGEIVWVQFVDGDANSPVYQSRVIVTREQMAAGTMTITGDDIPDFSLIVRKFLNNEHQVYEGDNSAVTLHANNPSGGSIAWDAFNLQYLGVVYPIAAGNTADLYTWWLYNGGAGSTLQSSNTFPTGLTEDDLILFLNKSGTPLNVQATDVVDGSLIVPQSIVTENLSANAIDGMTITSAIFQTITGLGSGAQGMLIENDPSGGVIKFWSGVASETPGVINPQAAQAQGNLLITTPTDPARGTFPAQLGMFSGLTAGGLTGPASQFTGALAVTGTTSLNGTVTLGGDFHMGTPTVLGTPVFSNGVTFNGVVTLGSDLHATGPTNITGNPTFTAGLGVTGSGNSVSIASPPTTTTAANVNYNATTGNLRQVTSLSKDKLKQLPLSQKSLDAVLRITPKTWYDRVEVEENKGRTKGLRRIPGLVAEDVVKHVPELGLYDDEGTLHGVAYDRVVAYLIPIVAEQQKRIAELEAKVKTLGE